MSFTTEKYVTESKQYQGDIIAFKTPSTQDNTEYCGNVHDLEYGIFVSMNIDRLVNQLQIPLSQIRNVYVVGEGSRDCAFEVWSVEPREKLADQQSSNKQFAVGFLEIHQKGLSTFAILVKEKLQCVAFSGFKVYVETDSGMIESSNPYACCMPLMGVVDSTRRIYNMGQNDGKHFVWSSITRQRLCSLFNTSTSNIKNIKIKFKGTKNQQYEIWVNHGWTFLGTFTSENGVYTVPYSRILASGYNDFSITSPNNFDTLEKEVTVTAEIKKTQVHNYDGTVNYESSNVQCFDIKFPNKEMPSVGFPLLITIHGGNWVNTMVETDVTNKNYYEYMSQDILDKGIVYVGLSYRGINNGACCNDMLTDIHNAILKILSDYGAYIDKTRIGLLGWSAGGHLALLYAYTKNTKETPIKTVISEASPVTLMDTYDYVNNVVENTEKREFLVSVLTGLCKKQLTMITSTDIKAISPSSCVPTKISANIFLFYGIGQDMSWLNKIYEKELLKNKLEKVTGDGAVPIIPVSEMANGRNKCTLKTYSDFSHNDFDLYYISNNKNYRIDVLNAINDLLS